jgi:endo-1,4-beta-xylanase
MKKVTLLTSILAAAVPAARAQELLPIVFQAEAGAIGAQFTVASDPATGIQYVAINSTVGGGSPGSAERVITYSVTFPSAGTYELYARLRVGPGTFNDDSMYYGSGFGIKNVAADNDWVRVNGLANAFGYTLPTDRVLGAGSAAGNVWKWTKLSAFPFDETPITFSVDASGLTQTFQLAGREDGLWLDKLAFGQQGVFFTVANLDNVTPGTTEPPPPPFVPAGPPMALDQPKFLGGVSSPPQDLNMTAYFNQVTPENAGKWGSVEATRDVMNWTQLDTAYNLAKNNLLKAPGDPRDGSPHPLPFRLHTLVWGNQQPAWIESLPPDEQRAEIEEWFAALAARYPGIDFIDVVNEPLHDPPAGAGNGNYIEALGGPGATGWDWVITAFALARERFPNAKLGINDFSVTNSAASAMQYAAIVELLKQRSLIDYVGVQGHAFSTRVPEATTRANLDLLAATGVPIHVTELDIDGPTDDVQLADYQRIFPAFWEHPGVRGITLWGYRPGHWRTAQGAYLVLDNGAERPAMVWLQDYVRNATLPPWIEVDPVAHQTVTVGDDVAFTCAGNGSSPLSYQWRKDGGAIVANASANTPTLTLTDVTTAAAGLYDCLVQNGAGSAISAAGSLTVEKAAASVTLEDLHQLYDGLPRAVSVTTDPPGLGVVVSYDGSGSPPVAPGAYAVVATVVDADYFGSAEATLQVSAAVIVRHAPSLNGRVAASVQVLLPESTTLNGGASVEGDLLVPGSPTVRLNGSPSYGGTLDGGGSASPSSHTVTLNGGATLRHVVRRTDAVSLPAVPAPPPPAGTRDVVLTSAGQDPGDFATLRNLTLNGNVGPVAVPAGSYGRFVVSGGSRLVLGGGSASEPAVYNLRGLVLNGDSALEVTGPVVLNLGSSAIVNGSAGHSGHQEWLTLNLAAGGLTLNGGASFEGSVAAPAGAVVINGSLRGAVAADRLTVNGGGLLRAAP